MNEDDKKKEHLKYREYSIREFDRLIVYLSTGAIIFTTGFVKDIVEINKDTDKCFLVTSWVLFAFTLLIILISHKTALLSMDSDFMEEDQISDLYNRITGFLNWISFFTLFLGIILFLIFTAQNI